jgi:ribosomal-protein-alanine N-acetyltransferase
VDRKNTLHEVVSKRLMLRPIRREEVLALHGIWIEESVRRFLWDGLIVPLKETEAIVERSQRLFQERGYGLWGVREFGGDELVGFAGYWHFRTSSSLELLFGVKSGQWNRGIATESAQSLIRYGFETLHFQTIHASTDFANAASIRVLEKLGMSLRQREIVDGLDTLFYTLQRSNYRSTD